MPFNYATQAPTFQIANQQLIDSASKTPFSIAGNAMNQLNDDIQNRVFADKAQKANSLDELRGLYNPQTKESQAVLANQSSLLNQLGQEQNRADLLDLQKDKFGLSKNTLNEKIRHNKKSEELAGTKSDKFSIKQNPVTGGFTVLNEKTGEFTEHGGNGNGINPAYIQLKSVETIDSNGNKVIRQVPFNKLSGLPAFAQGTDGTGDNTISSTGVGHKRPIVTQKDKDFVDNFGSLNEDFKALDDILNFEKHPDNKSLFGAVDGLWGDTVGKFAQTDDYKKQAMIDAMGSGMINKVIKQLGSNPSDVDFNAMKAQIPDKYDAPSVAKEKYLRFKKLYQEAVDRQLKRLKKSNPEYVSSLVSPLDNSDVFR